VAEELARLDSRVELDLIDFPDWGSEGYVHLLNRAPDAAARTVVHLHGPLVMFTKAIGWPAAGSQLHRVGSHMESTCMTAADAVFSSSACSADWCAEGYGIDRKSIDIVHLGVDRKLFTPTDVPKEVRPTVAFVGKMVRNKGVETLVDAALSVVRSIPELQIWLIGPEHEGLRSSLMERATSAGHPELIRSFGYRPAEELPDLLSRAHLFAAPSLYEGGPGFTVLEAMACGLPVVASDGSGLAEVVRHGDTGLLVPPMDTPGFAGAIEQLLLDANLREKMSDRAISTVASEADSDKCVARVEALYEKVVGERRAQR
jgi:glycosyltransferase involved in cell wall biosynthesis